MDLRRREFLQMMGLLGTSAAIGGCSEPARTLLPFVSPPEDVIPGHAAWYASTCRECPAGCGILAKNREGRIIKVEGNPIHPVNAGKLCPRGQASLHGLYNPDRIKSPLLRDTDGRLQPVSWKQALSYLVDGLREVTARDKPGSLAFLSDLASGTSEVMIRLWLREMGQNKGPLLYEPLAYEDLRTANRIVFDFDAVPSYHIDRCDFLLSLGAGFLETWLSNVEYARQFASFHRLEGSARNPFVYVGPRLSMTANNADLWIRVDPGDEYLVGLGLLRRILEQELVPGFPQAQKEAVLRAVKPWSLEKILAKTGMSEFLLDRVAMEFSRSRRPLVLAAGLSCCGPNALEAAVAANLLCSLVPGTRETIDFRTPSIFSHAARAEAVKQLCGAMRDGLVELLIVHRANPAFSLPASWEFDQALKAVPTVVCLGSHMDETTDRAHLVLPLHTPMESWDDHSPRPGVYGLMQPVMGPIHPTQHLGDILFASALRLKGTNPFPGPDYFGLLRERWRMIQRETGSIEDAGSFWERCVRQGGAWPKGESPGIGFPFRFSDFVFSPEDSIPPSLPDPDAFALAVYPTIQFYDGRSANRLWLQELPDPITQVTWGGWVEIHPETARKRDIARGDLLKVSSSFGSILVPALPVPTVSPGTLAIPLGQGHRSFGRFADGLPANPMELFPREIEPRSGAVSGQDLRVRMEKTGEVSLIAHTDGSLTQHDREMVRVMTGRDLQKAFEEGQQPHLDMPMPDGYTPDKDFYPSHDHTDYRWCMAVDLDRCIGCGACVVACYAENNVAVVGREQVLRGREMSWLRIQRYFDETGFAARWLPMLCQHCDSAPCESVCPVYAPHHSREGLNNQIYNRCFGTRFCSQNDPYKVRRFNYFTYTRPEPLHWQLNPDVLVRQKGIMEKCSFCVQRIADAKIRARIRGGKVGDGEFTTACAQTCPTDALTFGNLLDPESRVSRMIRDPRTFQVLAHLNTKPAVFYLKKVTGILEA